VLDFLLSSIQSAPAPAQSCVNWTAIVAAVAACIAAVAGIGAVLVGWLELGKLKVQIENAAKQFDRSMKVAFLAKRPDILLQLTPRFDELYAKLPRVGATKAGEDPAAAVRNYWGLQFQQYLFYLEGLIDDEIYRYWMRLRCKDYCLGQFEQFDKRTEDALKSIDNARFKDLIREVVGCWDKKNQEPNPQEIEKVMQLARQQRKEHLESLELDLPKLLR